MDSMIPILQRSFILRQTIFIITFRQMFPLFDLIFYELDKILELNFNDKVINYIDKNKQINDTNVNIFNISIDNSYDLDDILGSNYRKRNSKRTFSSFKSANHLFNIPKLNDSFEDISSKESSSLLPQENIIQSSSVETETICNTEIVKVVQKEQNVEKSLSDILVDTKDNIPQSTKSFSENDESSPKIENADHTITEITETTTPIKSITESPTTTTTTTTPPPPPIENESPNTTTTTTTTTTPPLPIESPNTTTTTTTTITTTPPPIENESPNTTITTTTTTITTTPPPIENDDLIENKKEVITTKSQEIVLSLKGKRLERSTPRVPPSFNASIPIDIFIEICYHLPPESLFSLMCVCKQFRFWLNSSVSYVTQDIWRTSRVNYLERIRLCPPVGMDELTYIKLTMLERGCQFCGTRNETPKVYWAFRVRCCQACLKKRVTSFENLPKWAKSPVDITMLVSYENINISDSDEKIVVYWNSHLEQTRREFMSTPTNQRSAWIQKKQHWISEVINEVIKRERIDELNRRRQSLEDERIFRTLLDEFRQIKDEKGQQKYTDRYVFQLPTYIEAQNTWKIPFMTNPWPNFIDRLKIEYPEVINKVNRLQQITDTMLSLITSYVTLASDVTISSEQGYQIYLSDPVIDCLQWCPSFINPPYVKNDASIPWSEEYLTKTLIPKLRKEARRLLKKSDIKRPGPFNSVRGCKILIKNEVEDKEFFKCKLCWKSSKKIYNYEGICRHLTSGRHSIARIDDERMIEVDREKVKKLLPVWFASFY